MAAAVENPFVALSVSVPEDAELAERDVSATGLDSAFRQLSRRLLDSGYALAYGGDLRAGGFTDQLLEVVGPLSEASSPPRRLRIYLADFIEAAAPPQDVAAAARVADVVRVSAGDTSTATASAPTNALTLSEMRRRVTDETAARVVIGGRLLDNEGRAPGVLEEAWWSVDTGKPLFVVGRFGGVGALIANTLLGHPSGLPVRSNSIPDGASMLAVFADRGFEGLHNALEVEENRRLAGGVSINVEEIVELVLRGLARLTGTTGDS